jgi:formylglycine-generating enzyme required for sulfatase activity
LALKGGLALAVVLLIISGGFLWRNIRNAAQPSTTVRPPVGTPAAPIAKTPAPASVSFRFSTIQLDANGKIVSRAIKETTYFPEDLGHGASLDMVAIPAGRFLMGAAANEAKQYPDESPQHEVTLPRFYLSKFEVTQAEWRAVAALPKVTRDLNPEPSKFKGDDLPVESVSWEEAFEFCARLSQKSGRVYHLPSESEWEYAARAGSEKPFAFGETITAEVANFDGTGHYGGAPIGVFREHTVAVGSLGAANAFGLYDMHGNVWEWCAGEYHPSYEGAPNDGSPSQAGNASKHRVLRGGGWNNLGADCRSANRLSYTQEGRSSNIGFRVALSL